LAAAAAFGVGVDQLTIRNMADRAS